MVKKINTLLFIFILLFVVKSEAQSKPILTDKEIKNTAKEVNKALEEFSVSIDKIDLSSLNEMLNTAIAIIDKNVDAAVKLADKIDTKKLEATAEKLSTKLERSVNTIELEKKLNSISEKIEKSTLPNNNK